MPSLSYHSLELLVIAHQARNRALLDAQRPGALTLDSIVTIVTAAASTEAFINEFAEHIAIFRAAQLEGLPPNMITCSDVIEELEESKAPVTVKYLIASQILGAAFAKDAAPFQDFAMLIQLRNAIMHAKPATNESSHQGPKSLILSRSVEMQRGSNPALNSLGSIASRYPASPAGPAPLPIRSSSGLLTCCRPVHRIQKVTSTGSKKRSGTTVDSRSRAD
jgi:hypothetical protein